MCAKETAAGSIQEFFPGTIPSSSSSEISSFTQNTPAKESSTTGTILTHVIKKDVLDAEIKWALKCVSSHYSYNSCADIGSLLSDMFPDSVIAKHFSCGPTKCSYLVCFGLAPYYRSLLSSTLKTAEYYSLSFDESLNKTLQRKQMDVYVRYWCNSDSEVKMRYLTSVFMGHATAEDLLKMLHEAIENLTLQKVLQLSMDGPAVNWKLFDLLQHEVKSDFKCEILNTGSCGLHTLNNAFKQGEKVSQWGIDNILTSLYYLFKDSPARTEDFLKVSQSRKMPKPFCKHRWLENVPACERALDIWTDVKKYIRCVEEGKFSKATSKSFVEIQKASKDELMPVKLNFFLSVCKILQPFLTLFQDDKPLLPFLAEELRKLVVDFLSNFSVMKKEHVLEDLSTVLKLSKFDFTVKETYSSINKISTGFAGDRIIKELTFHKNVTDKAVIELKLQCQDFIFAMVSKIIDKSPVKYSIVRCMSCLDPRHMVANPHDCYVKLKRILSALVDASRIRETDCEQILQQFNNFLSEIVLKNQSEFSKFSPADKGFRLDQFLHKHFSEEKYQKVWGIVKMLVILSHGQADIERGFSVNKAIEIENMAEKSYIAQRIILDHIRDSNIPVKDVPISKELRIAAAGSRQKYHSYLSEQQKKEENVVERRKRKSFFDELQQLKNKKARLQSAVEDLQASSDKLADKAESSGAMKYLTQSNSFRRTMKEKKVELDYVELQINTLLKEVKHT